MRTFELLSGRSGFGHCLWRQNDEHAVVVRIFRDDLERFRVTFCTGITKEVYGIVPAPVRRKQLVECIERLAGELGNLAAARYKHVGGECGRSASIRHDD